MGTTTQPCQGCEKAIMMTNATTMLPARHRQHLVLSITAVYQHAM
jgi:hypothetical protein